MSAQSFQESPKHGLLSKRDQQVLRASSSSPRRRWSPRRLSPSLLRRNQYEHLKVTSSASPKDKDDEEQFKENSSPLAELSMDSIPVPKLSSGRRGVLESPLSENVSLSTPPPKPRFAFGSFSRPGRFSRSFGSSSSKSREDSKREPHQRSKASPIFRLHVQSFPTGTEAALPETSIDHVYAGNRLDQERKSSHDEFDKLVKERRASVVTSQTQKHESSDLHELCGNLSTVDDVLRAKTFLMGNLSENGRIVNNASKTNFKGQTPLHVFSQNKVISTAIGIPNEHDSETREYLKLYQQPTFDPESNLEKHVIRFLVGDLLAAYPGAMMMRDDEGHIPFEAALVRWVDACHNRGVRHDDTHGIYSSNFASYTSAVNKVWESTSSTVINAVKLAGRGSMKMAHDLGVGAPNKTPRNAVDVEQGDDSRSAIFSPERGQDLGQTGKEPVMKAGANLKKKVFPGFVPLTPQARFTLMMLSAVVDQLDRYMSPELFRSRSSRIFSHLGYDVSKEVFERAKHEIRMFRDIYGSVDISSNVVQTIASIPDLMKTILLIEDDDDRAYALSTSIVRRVMLSNNSVGTWLTSMLQSDDRRLSQRAVEYLEAVSVECAGRQQTGKLKSPSIQENTRSKQLIDEVSRLQDFIPSLLALGDKGIEEASTTFIVKKVLDRILSRPFAATVVLCDVFFLTLLILGFRSAVNTLIGGGPLDVVLKWIYVANTGIFYFIIREIGKTISLFLISKRSRMYFLSFWNLIDVLATVLALVSTIAMRYHFTYRELGLEDTSALRGLLAITTGFLWLRVLSLLKAINMQLATFVLAILQITKDILWFCVILLTLVVSFAQMFFTLLAPSTCASDDAPEMQCKQTEYLLRVYTILLGDFGNFEREQFTSGFSVFLVVFYSFLVTVVLLNVLIAIASDSYEKCLIRSHNLFGRARVMLIAELVSFQNLLKKTDHHDNTAFMTSQHLYSKWWSSGPWNQDWSRGSVVFFSTSLSVVVAWTIAELFGYSRGERHGNILFSLASVIVNVLVFAAIMVFLANNAPSTQKDSVGEKDEPQDSCIQRAMLRLLGASRESGLEGSLKNGEVNEWNGRVHYLQREMQRIADQQTSLAVEQARSLETLVNQSESRLRSDLTVLEDEFAGFRSRLMDEVKGTKQTNANVTIAVEELKTLISMAASTSAYKSPVPSEVDIHNTVFVRYDGE